VAACNDDILGHRPIDAVWTTRRIQIPGDRFRRPQSDTGQIDIAALTFVQKLSMRRDLFFIGMSGWTKRKQDAGCQHDQCDRRPFHIPRK